MSGMRHMLTPLIGQPGCLRPKDSRMTHGIDRT
jgi:hypothetical protein